MEKLLIQADTGGRTAARPGGGEPADAPSGMSGEVTNGASPGGVAGDRPMPDTMPKPGQGRLTRPGWPAFTASIRPAVLHAPLTPQLGRSTALTDWNDYEVSQGRAATRASLRAAGLQKLATQDERVVVRSRAAERQGAGLSA